MRCKDVYKRQVCEQIITVAPDVIKEAVEAGSVKVISNPSLATEPVSPNIMKNTMSVSYTHL